MPVQKPLCEQCVHRDEIAGGRGDCHLRRYDQTAYAAIAAGYERQCVRFKLGDRMQRVVPIEHPDQMSLIDG